MVFDGFELFIIEGYQSKKEFGTGRPVKVNFLTVVNITECCKLVHQVVIRKDVSDQFRLVESCGGNRVQVSFQFLERFFGFNGDELINFDKFEEIFAFVRFIELVMLMED